MAIQLDPVELGFKRPFTQEVSETLRLRNPNSDPIAFKVKTTAPKQYCVRPNSGKIDGGQQVEVQVLLQAMKEDPPLETKCRDKFLVQSVAVPPNQDFSTWAGVEESAKSSIQEKKIRVNFLPADGTYTSTPSRRSTTGAHYHEDEPPAYSSPVSAATTPAHSALPTGPVSKPESRPEGSKSLGDAVNSAHNPVTSNTTSSMAGTATGAATGTAAAVAAAMPSSTDDVKAQLAEAQATIGRLTKQLQDSTGLRQRKVDGSSSAKGASIGTASMEVQQGPPNGVPVPIVAALCLLSFLLAYLFF